MRPGLGGILLVVATCCLAAADLEQELSAAGAVVGTVREALEMRLADGRLTEANAQLLALFPEATRSAAECLLLGNMLYGMDQPLSYALHRQAAQQLPGETSAALEWGMEQHRAGEHSGALEAYDAFSAAHPQFAPVHGLAADCLIRLGRTRDAVLRWQRSEQARQGTLVQLETMVCEIYKDHTQQRRRAELYDQAAKGDIDAAVELVALDGDFERDWWNTGPMHSYLARDLALIEALPVDPRVMAARCTCACAMGDGKADVVRASLIDGGMVIDPQRTLPHDPALTSLLLGFAIDAEIMTRTDALQWFGDRLLADARAAGDADLWNVVAYLNRDTPRIDALEKEAWEATGDARFAIAWLAMRVADGALEPDDPVLTVALQRHAENAWILRYAIAANAEPGEALLVQAITAEYRRFSATGGVSALNGRPSARALRGYFTELAKRLD